MSNPLSIASRLYFTAEVRRCIVKGLNRGLSNSYTEQEKERIAMLIIDELGLASETLLKIVKDFLERNK